MPAKVSAKPTSTAADSTIKGDKKKKKTRRGKPSYSYAIYIKSVLKQVHPDTGLHPKAMSVLNSMNIDLFERIAAEASRLAHCNKKPTITSREIETAVKLVLPGDLVQHAISEGSKAVAKYKTSRN